MWVPPGDVTRPKCETTIQCSTLCPCFEHLSMAWSHILFKAKCFSPLQTPSAVTKTRAPQSVIRSAKESAEKPANLVRYE